MPADIQQDDLDLLAAEFALGLTEGADHTAATQRLRDDPDFARSVDDWTRNLSPLLNAVAPRTPPASLWAEIERRLNSDRDEVVADATATKATVAANDDELNRRVRFWRAATALAGAIAAALLLVLVLRPADRVMVPVPPGPVAIAQLASDAGDQIAAARLDTTGRSLRLRAIAIPGDTDPGAVAVLWVIPNDGTPRLLGAVERGGMTMVPLDETHRRLIAEGAVLAVSLEERDETYVAPEGPIVGTGVVTLL